MWAIIAIEIAVDRGWTNLWLECDSSLVNLAFAKPEMAPWDIIKRWKTCIALTQNMQLTVTHIYREGNKCANRLANLGLHAKHDFLWFFLFTLILKGKFLEKSFRVS